MKQQNLVSLLKVYCDMTFQGKRQNEQAKFQEEKVMNHLIYFFKECLNHQMVVIAEEDQDGQNGQEDPENQDVQDVQDGQDVVINK
jgi:hypothetical protein